jgi:hypothetical protein
MPDAVFTFGWPEGGEDAPCSPAHHPDSAPTVCQCRAPEPCFAHPDGRPLIKAAPAWNEPHPESPVARRGRELAEGPTLADELSPRLRELTGWELAEATRILLAEHARRALHLSPAHSRLSA